MNRTRIPARRMTFILFLVLSALTLLACDLAASLSQGNAPGAASTSTSGEENQPIQPTPPTRPTQPTRPTPPPAPSDWMVVTDTTGACQAATPPDWQLGVDFFLEAEEAVPGPFENAPGQYPPTGLTLWGTDGESEVPEGHWFQTRISLVSGDLVCSVWRVREATDFTADEKSVMDQVGSTLMEVD